MNTTLHAQPYDISAAGFYFDSADAFREKAATAVNAHGCPVEEFEIQFIDGEAIDAALASAIGVHQGNIETFFESIENWDTHQKQAAIIAASECGHTLDWGSDPDQLDIDIYEAESLRELAEQFVDEGLFGDIPERLLPYLDYDAIARDLSCDYAETVIDGVRLVYRGG